MSEKKKTTLEQIRKRSEALISALDQEYYETGAGLKDTSNVAGIVEQFSDLSRSSTYETIQELYTDFDSDADSEEKKRLGYLLEFLAGQKLEAVLADITDEISNTESSMSADMNGETIAYRNLSVRIRNEKNRSKRGELYRAMMELVGKLNGLHTKGLQLSVETVKKLGFDGYRQAFERLSGVSVLPIVKQMQKLLTETQEIYASSLADLLDRKLGIALGEASRHDVMHAFRGGEFDSLFPLGGEARIAKNLADGLGIDVTAGGNVILDTEPREKKSPRAFCCPIEVPNRVILVTKPSGGADDYASYLHELGHALHYAHVDVSTPFEFAYLGDNSVTEAFAILFDSLLLNADFLESQFPGQDTEPYRQAALLQALAQYRRYGAKIAYEERLYDDVYSDLEAQSVRYVELLSSASLVEYPAELFLEDVDPWYYAIRYLRAWMLSAHMADYFEGIFGQMWFADKRCGKALLELWKCGQQQNAEEVAAEIGVEELSVAPLITRVQQLGMTT